MSKLNSNRHSITISIGSITQLAQHLLLQF